MSGNWRLLISFCAWLLIMVGCAAPPAGGGGAEVTARVIVTSDFGREVLLNKTLKLEPGTSAVKALEAVAAVETAYGGGFVTAINGLRSEYTMTGGKKRDWFFYINGISGRTGGLDYILHGGDVERWDFHDWGYAMFTPALVGDFPEPFRHGYGGTAYGTVVVPAPTFEDEAGALASELAGYGLEQVSVKTFDELSPEEKGRFNLILLGPYHFSPIAELNRVGRRLGFYAYFEGASLKLIGPGGEVRGEYEKGSGVIQATQSPWNPNGVGASQNVVWMVSGADEGGVRQALHVLLEQPEKLRHALAIAVAEGQVLRVPR